MAWAGRALALAGLVLTATTARAHDTQLSSARLTLHARVVDAQLDLDGRDVDAALGLHLSGPDRRIAPGAVDTHAERIGGWIGTQVGVSIDATRCPIEVRSLAAVGEHVRAQLRFDCPPAAGTLTWRATLFGSVDPRARHMVTVDGDVQRMGLLTTTAPTLALVTTQATVAEVWGRYVAAGIEHIAIGFDHIAFLIATVAWGRRIGPLVRVVTAFTLAHSITLALAVLEVASIPGAWVEAAIAASIVWVSAENFFVRDVGRRWPLTFVFGLIHGFGFASVLADYGLPHDARVAALAAFNVGVEVGQLAIVGTALVLLRGIDAWQRRAGVARVPDPRVVKAISVAIGAAGVVWLFERIGAIAAPQ